MNFCRISLSICSIVLSAVASPGYAFEASPAPAATPASGTHATRSAERKKNRAAVAAANKRGEIPETDEASEAPQATPATGTHETRSAERKRRRAAMAEANKRGEIPQTNEAGEIKK
jgi:hypothetical protein